MKLQNNSVFVGNELQNARHAGNKVNNKTNRKTIDATGLKAQFDPIAAKREDAKKKAMKIVGDAFANECKIDNDLDGRRQRVRDMLAENGEAAKEIKVYEDMRIDLRNQYGVDPDSQEEKDLRLLEKELDSHRPDSQITLTKEDYEELERIKKAGLSEYQQRSLEIRGYEGPAKDTIYNNSIEIKTENAIISSTEIERLKSHTMIDAQDAAEDIMDAASKEIMGMLVDEAKDHIDDEAEKAKEEAKEKAKEKEELEEKIEKNKEEKKEKERLTEEILEGVSELAVNTTDMESAQQELKDMMSKLSLIEDDIKGAAVDKTL